jgi:NAD(P)-dependent dehydrogenase (short-subunit alcohol dehydrogenase family)
MGRVPYPNRSGDLAMRELSIPHAKPMSTAEPAHSAIRSALGARILVTLLAALERRGGKRGVAGICLGGGEATAIALELIQDCSAGSKREYLSMIPKGVAAVVTGGGSGLGAASAAKLANEGARVAIFDMNEETGRAQAASIGGSFYKVDVSDAASVAAAIAEAERAHGVARILVNCAGIAYGAKTVGKEFAPHPLEQFRKVVEINLIGTFNTITQFAMRLAQAEPIGEERGVVVNTASVAAFDGQVGQAAYSASKGGIVGMTLPIARDLAQHAIRVVTIAPGIFLTPMMASLPQNVQDALGKQVPFPSRLGNPDEYALLVHSIVINPMLNGETIRLDGAIRMPPR